MSSFSHEYYMRLALEEAEKSVLSGSLPFATVVLDELGNIVWKDHDRVHEYCDPTAHAEINAIRGLCKKLGKTKLEGYTFYTTSEPCLTCLSACIKAKVSILYFGAPIEANASLVISSYEIAEKSKKHPIQITGGILENECLTQRKKYT